MGEPILHHLGIEASLPTRALRAPKHLKIVMPLTASTSIGGVFRMPVFKSPSGFAIGRSDLSLGDPEPSYWLAAHRRGVFLRGLNIRPLRGWLLAGEGAGEPRFELRVVGGGVRRGHGARRLADSTRRGRSSLHPRQQQEEPEPLLGAGDGVNSPSCVKPPSGAGLAVADSFSPFTPSLPRPLPRQARPTAVSCACLPPPYPTSL